MENSKPRRPLDRMDFYRLARDYNLLDRGRTLKMERVANVTHTKRALERRGIKDGEDCHAYNMGRFFYLRKLSDKLMDFKK